MYPIAKAGACDTMYTFLQPSILFPIKKSGGNSGTEKNFLTVYKSCIICMCLQDERYGQMRGLRVFLITAAVLKYTFI